MVRQHHRLNGHEFEQALGDTEGPGSLLSYSPWGCRVGYDLVTEQQQKLMNQPALTAVDILVAAIQSFLTL